MAKYPGADGVLEFVSVDSGAPSRYIFRELALANTATSNCHAPVESELELFGFSETLASTVSATALAVFVCQTRQRFVPPAAAGPKRIIPKLAERLVGLTQAAKLNGGPLTGVGKELPL